MNLIDENVPAGTATTRYEGPTFKNAVCRGSFQLGTACGSCERCVLNIIASSPPIAPTTSSEFGTSNYVVGFLFDDDARRVVLIEKRKPAYQRGLLNGVGGSIEIGEEADAAMSREFGEETGVPYPAAYWSKFLDLATFNSIDGDKARPAAVAFYKAFNTKVLEETRTTTQERIHKVALDDFHLFKTMPNLAWLIPMALRRDHKLRYEMKEI